MAEALDWWKRTVLIALRDDWTSPTGFISPLLADMFPELELDDIPDDPFGVVEPLMLGVVSWLMSEKLVYPGTRDDRGRFIDWKPVDVSLEAVVKAATSDLLAPTDSVWLRFTPLGETLHFRTVVAGSGEERRT